jgi:hypothetical protein
MKAYVNVAEAERHSMEIMAFFDVSEHIIEVAVYLTVESQPIGLDNH